MHRVFILTTAAALSLAACSNADAPGEAAAATSAVARASTTAASTPSTAAPTTASAPAAPTTADRSDSSISADPAAATVPPTGAVSRDDLVRFVAATESVLGGTAAGGVVHDAPEIYIAIGQSACARFSSGDTFAEVSDDLRAALVSTSAAEADRLVGAILGAATQTICPEHANLI